MGITGLLPFLDKYSKKTNISEFSGQTVAIDSYCWLHKGAFSCADKIIMGQSTNLYVTYCMKLVNMLLSHNIKPILVFDGRNLPAKAATEAKRRESRLVNRKRAAELIKMGNISEGKNLMKRSLDVTHCMALNLIKECQAHNIDCIVAPYEADAQLAYLNLSGIVDIIITEDSDLILFGCKKILFKMDLYGYGTLVEQHKLHLAMGMKLSNFHMDKFLHMCILSGCDYLTSLPGIGLIKACKFIVKNKEENIYNASQRCGSLCSEKFVAKQMSIWSKNIQIRDSVDINATEKKEKKEASTNKCGIASKVLVTTNSRTKDMTSRKRSFKDIATDVHSFESIEEIIEIPGQLKKKLRDDVSKLWLTGIQSKANSSDTKRISANLEKTNTLNNEKRLNQINPNIFSKRRFSVKNKFNETVIDEASTVTSKFFSLPTEGQRRDNKKMDEIEFILFKVDQKEENNLNNNKLQYLDVSFEMENVDKKSKVEKNPNFSASNSEQPILSVNSVINLDQRKNIVDEFSKKMRSENDRISNVLSKDLDDHMCFSISSKRFLEDRSHFFTSKEAALKKIKSDKVLSPRNQEVLQLSQVPSTPRSIARNMKKNSLIRKQQSLLTMYGFQKKILLNVKNQMKQVEEVEGTLPNCA